MPRHRRPAVLARPDDEAKTRAGAIALHIPPHACLYASCLIDLLISPLMLLSITVKRAKERTPMSPSLMKELVRSRFVTISVKYCSSDGGLQRALARDHFSCMITKGSISAERPLFSSPGSSNGVHRARVYHRTAHQWRCRPRQQACTPFRNTDVDLAFNRACSCTTRHGPWSTNRFLQRGTRWC